MADLFPPGETVPIPIGDLLLHQAVAYTSDADAYYIETMPQILSRFPSVTAATYWELTVAEHQALVDYAS